ncbi:chain length determinant protein EpsF [Rhodoferax lacus]|uniref:Chain length determinant protein EpsF n=1 Tax=Rhodoferax lacus TaxID=2184758 RepID=A0A3E1R8Z6_9BURK|nr:chain length determinant protein EpsF [Rhodoferax lacus]RFO95797.1 chain length determinant protein EpsF [Rhodoferax lacus]
MSFHQFLLILRARYIAALAVLFVTVAAVTGYSLWLPKQYSASTAIVLDVKSVDPVTGTSSQSMAGAGYMATQLDIINSDRTARAVVKNLKLEGSSSVQEMWLDATKGRGQLIDWLSSLLQKNLDVKPSRESSVININYTATDPAFAATVANAFAQAYIDVNLDLRLAPARQYAAFFEEQTKTARLQVEQAQKALSDYQQKNGIVSADDRLDYETAKLNDTSSQLTGVQAQTTDSQSKRQSSKADTIAEVMQNPLVNGLKTDIARLEARLVESSGNLGKNHPQTLRSQSELATLKSQLEQETAKVTSSIETTYQVGKQREQQLSNALSTQKGRVLMLNKQRDELIVLRRELDSAQRLFDSMSARASQSNVESKTDQTNIAVLNPAIAPTKASSPRVFLNVLVSVFIGTLLGIGLALALELRRRRVRSDEDLLDALGIPMLGQISSANRVMKPSRLGARA